jgi:hypothetical protein
VKALVYQSLAHYRLASVHGKSDEYGLQVARLIAAHNILEDIKKNKLKGLSTETTAWFNVVYAVSSAHFFVSKAVIDDAHSALYGKKNSK